MNKSRNIVSWKQAGSSIFMILSLLWLTISIPYVYAANKAVQTENHRSGEDNTNPFSSTTEERNESSVNTLSEYLHDLNQDGHHFTLLTKYYKCHPSNLYFAFHPELISPPPEV